MKKFFKYLLVLIGIVFAIGILGFAFIEIRGVPSYEAKKIDYKVEITPERVERGNH